MNNDENQFEDEPLASVHELPHRSNKKFAEMRDRPLVKLEIAHNFGRHRAGYNHPYCPLCIRGIYR